MNVTIHTAENGEFYVNNIKEIKSFYNAEPETITDWEKFVVYRGYDYVFIGDTIVSLSSSEIKVVQFESKS